MSTYVNSESTRKALLMAAGELFAEHGIDAVTIRAIADKAGEHFGIINYHFGNREGLLEAVINFAGELWQARPLDAVLRENQDLLKTHDGQNALITKMVEVFFAVTFSPEKPSWCGTLMFQIVHRDLEISEKIFSSNFVPINDAFITVYRTVTGDQDFERAHSWSMAVIAPAILAAVDPRSINRSHPDKSSSDKYLLKLQTACIRNAVLSLDFIVKHNNKMEQ